MAKTPVQKTADDSRSDQTGPLRSIPGLAMNGAGKPARFLTQHRLKIRKKNRSAITDKREPVTTQVEAHRVRRRLKPISPKTVAILVQAATIEGKSVKNFVMTAATRAARRTIEQTHLIRLSSKEQQRFAEILLDPADPTPALERAHEAHTRLVR